MRCAWTACRSPKAATSSVPAWLIALLAGGAAVLSFAPFGLAALAPLSLAVLAWLLTGQSDPLRTVFDLQDERAAAASVESVPSGGSSA